MVALLVCAGCKDRPLESNGESGSEGQDSLVELKTDLPLAKNDKGYTPKKRAGEPLLVPLGTRLLSRGREVTSSGSSPISGELEMITDGNQNPNRIGYDVELLRGLQWIQIDLGKPHSIYAVLVWHYYLPDTLDDYFNEGEYDYLARVYQDVVIQISDDPSFKKDVTTVFNNDHDNSAGFGKGEDDTYIETSEGLWVGAEGAIGRYVRLYSNGHIRLLNGIEKEPETEHSYIKSNNYIEVEVYGR